MCSNFLRLLMLCSVIVVLSACGGGGGAVAPPTPPPPSGSLDTSFDADGQVTTFFLSGSVDTAQALAIQPDGKIVVAGSTLNGTTFNFALARYNPDGSPDTSFDIDGIAEIDLSSGGNDYAYSLAIQPDGKIVAAGSSVNASSATVFAVVRFNSDGTLDTSFGAGGIAGVVKTSFGGVYSEALGVAIQADGKIVAAGTADGSSGTQEFALARYNADGSLDTNFDGDGRVTTNFVGDGEGANAIAIQSDGKIIVVGSTLDGGGSTDFAIARYHANGSLDTGFSTDGLDTANFGSGHDILYAVALQPDGKIVAAGFTRNVVSDDFAILRYLGDGTRDAGFGSNGIVVTDITGSDHFDQARAVALQPDGKIVAAGRTTSAGSATDKFAFSRYNPDGSLDTSFDTDGKLVIDLATEGEFATALAIQPDGKLVATGSAFNGTDSDFAVVRVNP